MISSVSNFNAPKSNGVAFKGFLSVNSVNKVKDGVKKAVDEFVLNTDSIVHMSPLEKINGYAFGAKIKTVLNELIEIPAFRKNGTGVTYEYILNRFEEAVKKGFSNIA